MKKAIKTLALLLCAAAMMTSYSCHSNGNKLAQFEKKATEFKAALDPSNKVIAERIDTIAQKVFYLEPNQEAEGVHPIHNILVHDFATDKTQSLLPDEERINEYLIWGELVDDKDEEFSSFNHCFNLDYRSSELIGDRLFMMIHTECSYEMETSLLFYVDILDNSLHYVCTCDDVNYDKEKGTIDVHNDLMKFAGADLEYNYTLSASLSDKEYAAKRDEVEGICNRMSEQWREENLD